MNITAIPSNNDASILDLAAATAGTGFVPAQQGSGLGAIAANLPDNSPVQSEKSIPSPIAHLKKFHLDLKANKPEAVNEWRGMLTIIALAKCKVFDIDIKLISLANSRDYGINNATPLSETIRNELLAERNITDWPETGYGSYVFPVFYLNSQPFAFYVPGMCLCPYKNIDTNCFNSVEWYDAGIWKNVADHGVLDQSLVNKLYRWLVDLSTAFTRNFNPLINFIQDIQAIMQTNAALVVSNNALAPKQGAWNQDIMSAFGQGNPILYQAPTNGTQAPVRILNKLLLAFVPHAQNISYDTPLSNEPYDPIKDYRISKGMLTPKKFRCHNSNLYIIPPFTDEICNYICNGTIDKNNVNWSVVFDEQQDMIICTCTVNFNDERGTQSTRECYPWSQIIYTTSLPYLSLWPYIDDTNNSWNEYFVAAERSKAFDVTVMREYSYLERNVNVRRLSDDLIIDVISKSVTDKADKYNVQSAYNKNSFEMYKSVNNPNAIRFSFNDANNNNEATSLGVWFIDKSKAHHVEPAISQSFDISLDFGTTSSNIFIKNPVNPIARYINAPGKYVYDIFNPYYQNGDIEDLLYYVIQNYYLFGTKTGELGKIFTFGQNFSASNAAGTVNDIIAYISGRAVIVDHTYLNKRLDETDDDGIKNMLKWDVNNPDLIKARNNFIMTILTWALLDAKLSGAQTVNIRLSCPSENIGSGILNSVAAVLQNLGAKSGLAINSVPRTEAQADGYFFSQALRMNGYGYGTAYPNAIDGYLVADLGGGTTDVAIWQSDPGDTTPKNRAECTIKYAGNEIIGNSILLGATRDHFSEIWQRNDITAEAIEKYSKLSNINTLNITQNNDTLNSKFRLLDYIIEHSKPINNLGGANHQYMLQLIRVKYYSLFYTIARFAGRRNCITYHNTFSVWLAGCASKGYTNFCVPRANDQADGGASFEECVAMIFEQYMIPEDRDLPFTVMQPLARNKEEVAIGLIHIDTNNVGKGEHRLQRRLGALLNNQQNINVPEDDKDDTDDTTIEPDNNIVNPMPQNLEDELRSSYSQLLKVLIALERVGGYNTDVLERMKLENDAANSFFNRNFNNIKEYVDRYYNPASDDIYTDYFATYAIEFMLCGFLGSNP